MPRIAPVPPSEATDKVAETYRRIGELLGGSTIPTPFLQYARVPAFLQDFYTNFKKFVWSDGAVDARTKATLALAVSCALRCPSWADFFALRCTALGFSEQHVADTIAVAAACQMYNVFFKFGELSGNDLSSATGPGLRAHTFANTSLDARLVELVNIAISDISGCKPCTTGHVESASRLGMTGAALVECIQCAATMAAGCAFLNAAD